MNFFEKGLKSFFLDFIKCIMLYKGIHEMDFRDFFDPSIYVV